MREYPHDVSISLKTMDRSSGHKELYARFKVRDPSERRPLINVCHACLLIRIMMTRAVAGGRWTRYLGKGSLGSRLLRSVPRGRSPRCRQRGALRVEPRM